jgi:hypothetical protein
MDISLSLSTNLDLAHDEGSGRLDQEAQEIAEPFVQQKDCGALGIFSKSPQTKGPKEKKRKKTFLKSKKHCQQTC